MYAAFPRSDYYAQSDCLQGLGLSYEFSHSYSPSSFTSLSGSPVFMNEDSCETVEVACCSHILATLCGPQSSYRVVAGFPVLIFGSPAVMDTLDPYSYELMVISV